MQQPLRDFRQDRRGATAVEYALLMALVALLSFLALEGIGGGLKAIFEKISSHL